MEERGRATVIKHEQCSAAQCRSKPPRTEPRSRRPIARPDQTRLASPHDFRHRNWVWGGLRRSNATTLRPGLDHPWPAHPLYRAVHTQPEPDSESPHPQHTPTSTGLRYVLLRYARTSPKQNLSTCPKPKPKGPRLSPALLYIHAHQLLTLVRSTLRLL
jgi:hypothetical protein